MLKGKGQFIIPESFPDYSKAEFWQKRYKLEKGKTYDWLLPYQKIKGLLLKKLNQNYNSEILVIGSGNSQLSEKLYLDGYHNITNFDFSSTVIQQMQERLKKYDQMDHYQMDVCSPVIKEIDANTFDVIIDKGTLDCILCRQDGLQAANNLFQEMQRLLSDGGHYFIVSSGPADSRKQLLKQSNLSWDVEIFQIRNLLILDYSVSEIKQQQHKISEFLTRFLLLHIHLHKKLRVKLDRARLID